MIALTILLRRVAFDRGTSSLNIIQQATDYAHIARSQTCGQEISPLSKPIEVDYCA
jgi:hypothetical protein